jgi:DNA-directed RNA polymerase subunit RPC12/RpoP
MATTVPDRLSILIQCVRCGNELIAPEKSELRDGRYIGHLWLCPKCHAKFETLESVPVEALTADDVAPTLLVA